MWAAEHQIARGRPRRGARARAVTRRAIWPASFGLLGLAISAYLAATHYFSAQVPLACATGGIVDCEQVTSSSESMIGPLPVALLGLLWFAAFMLVLVARRGQPNSPLLFAQLAWSI